MFRLMLAKRPAWALVAWFSALLAIRAAAAVPALGPVAMEAYTQTVVVTFKSEEAAARACVRIAPLYHDLRAAFSTRMDDCNLGDLRVAEVMAQFGQKGTFYLNDPRYWWEDSHNRRDAGPVCPETDICRRLLARAGEAGQPTGNTLGDHTLTHEALPALSKNRAFREIMSGRVALETTAAAPVVTFAYPFIHFRSYFRDGTDRADLEEMLRRAGIYQLAEHRYNEGRDSGLQDGLFIVCDASDWGGYLRENVLTQARPAEERPLFLVTMHAWAKSWGGPEFPKLAEIYRRWSGRPDWWYCNVNEYAAYRYQARHAQMTIRVEGRTVRATLARPDPLDLGDRTPLTIRVTGVSRDEVLSLESPGAEVRPVAIEGGAAFDLFHGRGRDVIERYATTDNPTNSEQWDQAVAAVEGLRALLFRRGNVLTLRLRNEGPAAVEDVRVVFRLPLRWEEGVIRRRVGPLAGGAEATVEATLTERADAVHYSDGTEYDVAQVDFRGGRLYATCEAPGSEPAAFFARNGFRVLGPLPGDLAGFDPQAFAQALLEGAPPAAAYELPGGGKAAWGIRDPAWAARLDPDIIPTTGRWSTPASFQDDPALPYPRAGTHYLLHGLIQSPEDRTVRAVFPRKGVKWLSLNGRKVEGDALVLKKGANDLRILFLPSDAEGPVFNENIYGCYFRLTDAAGNRVQEVRFEKPPAPGSSPARSTSASP